MTDSTSSLNNQQIAQIEKRSGFGKIAAGMLAAGISGYIMTQLSLHGTNFELLGLSSEIVKSQIVAALTGLFVAFTPKHFVAGVTDGIVFVKQTWRTWRTAWTSQG